MKKSIIFMFFAIAIYACGNSDAGDTADNTSGSEPVATADPAPDGEKIYKQYCVTCHGIAGNMGASGAFNLQESTIEKDSIMAVVTNGRNAMTPFKSLLNEEKISAVADYVQTLRK